MAVREILHYPDKRLRAAGRPITEFGPELQQLVEDMAETMYAASGVGLAAPQIGEALRLFVIDVAAGDDEAPSDLRVFANPEILELHGEVVWEEGCLSFPGVQEEIERAERVRVKAQDAEGNWFELETDGLLAIAIQHEYDHIEGQLMIDRMGRLRRRVVEREMKKRAASSAEASA